MISPARARLLLLPAILFMLMPVGPAGATELTLEQALELGETANVSALVGQESVTQAVEAARQQRSNLLPKISLDLQQERNQEVQVSATGVVQNAPFNRFDTNLTGSLSLLDPTQIATYEAARTGVKVAQLGYRQTLQGVLAAVAQGYFTHLRDLKSMEVIQANIHQAQVLLDLAQAQLKAGVATQIDVTRAESQLAIAEQSRLQQETVIYQSELQLKQLLGLDPSGPLQLANFAVRRDALTMSETSVEQAALLKRPDYLQAEKTLDEARQAVRAAKFEHLPVLSLFGQYGYSTTTYDEGNQKTAWLAGAQFSLPVFDGLKISSDKRLAESLWRAQAYRLRDLQRQISASVRLALQDARSWLAQIDVAQKGYDLANEELRLARTRFEQGVADNTEVVNAQNALAVAADNRVEAVYQYNLSRVNLAATLGDVRLILREQQG